MSVRVPVRPAIAAAIAVAALLLFGALSTLHVVGSYTTEPDFYVFFAPDAARILDGVFPADPFHGPGYPLVLAAVSLLNVSFFTAGKWISVVSAAAVLSLAFLLFARLFGTAAGVGAALLTLVATRFAFYAYYASSDVLFLALVLLALVLVTTGSWSIGLRSASSAAVLGFAYLVRYNAVAAVAAFVAAIVITDLFDLRLRERLRPAAVFVAVFLATVAPWLVLDTIYRGSPIANSNYLNMATLFYPKLVGGKVFFDGVLPAAEHFRSAGDVLRFDPAEAFRNVAANLAGNVWRSAELNGLLTWIAGLAGIALALVTRRSRALSLVLLTALAVFLLYGLIHWEIRYHFLSSVVLAGFASFLVTAIGTRTSPVIGFAIFLVLFMPQVPKTDRIVRQDLRRQPTVFLRACEPFRRANVRDARILAWKPQLSGICGQQWVFVPEIASLDDLRSTMQRHRAAWFVFSDQEAMHWRALGSLADPAAAPKWLEAVWSEPASRFTLYRMRGADPPPGQEPVRASVLPPLYHRRP